jgi:protein-disulfide isomerase
MSKYPWALGLLCLLVLACGPAPAPVASPVKVTQVAVAQVDPGAVRGDEVDDADPGPIPVGAADPQLGRRDAPVTIVEFGDFQCPFCGRAQVTMREIRERYGDKVRLVWKNAPLPFHPRARPAAVAAMMIFERMGNEAFWTTLDAFYAAQAHLEDIVAAAGNRLGISPGKPAPASEHAEAKIDADLSLAKEVDAVATPTFFVNGLMLVGAQHADKFSAVIDEQLKKAEDLLARGTPGRRLYAELAKAQYRKEPPKPPPPPPKPAEEDRTVWLVPVGGSAVRGKATAPVTIVEFSDFQCPFCRRVVPTLAEIQQIYGDKVRLVFKHNPLPFHPRAAPAAELAIEARAQKGDKGFWAAHDLLFADQTKLDEADLLVHAKTLGLDLTRVDAAIAKRKHQREIDADQDLGDDLQASGTPHFFINGRRLVGAQPIEKFKAVIDEELAKAEALIKGGVPAAQVYARLQTGAKTAPPPEKKKIPPPTRDNPSRGPAGAKVVVQFFSDFECPFCKRVVPTVEELEKAFPGKIRLVWRNKPLPMHAHAELASEAAMEAFEQKGAAGFFAMYELLYAASGQQGALERPALETYAAQIGLDPVRFAHALDTQSHKAVIDADNKIGDDAGIFGTPAFVINGYFVSGAQPLGKFKKIVARALAEAK